MDRILELFKQAGGQNYIGEAITQEEHMTQSAKFATDAGASKETILAALFHDVGHLIGLIDASIPTMVGSEGDLGATNHECIGASFLVTLGFPPTTVDLVKNHVQAKRYLCWKNPAYHDKLSQASKGTLVLQGGPMSDLEALQFEKNPLKDTILKMRTWDEAAKIVNPTFEVPPLENYRSMVEEVISERNQYILQHQFPYYKLSQEQLSNFDRDGFIVLKDLFSEGLKPKIVKWVDEIQSWSPTPGRHMCYSERDDKDSSKLMLCRTENFLPFHDDMRALLSSDGPVMDTLEQLMNERAIVFKEKVNYKLAGGLGFPAHQDAPAFISFGQRNHLTLNVAIDAATPANGCLQVAPGHHKTGLFPQDPVHHGLSVEEEAKLKNWQDVPLDVGDTLIFSSWLPHRSGSNTTALSRRALYITYNGKTDGDFREDYYVKKRAEFPQECERLPGVDYSEGAKTFNIATPIVS